MPRARAVRREGVVELLELVLIGSADLRGAACRGRGPLFDPDVGHRALGYDSDEERETAVAATCISCPARGACWAWASGLNSQRVAGPTAASVSVASSMRSRPSGRPRRRAALQAPTELTPASEDPEPTLARPRPTRRRGARHRVRPSIHRSRRTP